MMTGKQWILISAAALAAAAAAAVVVMMMTWPQGGPAADPTDSRLVALGRTVYAGHCAGCHGEALEGQPDWRQRLPSGRLPAPPHDASGHTWHHDDVTLSRIIRDGIAALAPPGYQSDMGGFGGQLSEREIAAVLAYIKSTWPPEIRARQAEISRSSGGG